MRIVILNSEEVASLADTGHVNVVRKVKWPLRSETDGCKRRIFLCEDADEVNGLLEKRHRHPCRRPQTPYGFVGSSLCVKEVWAPVRWRRGSVEMVGREHWDNVKRCFLSKSGKFAYEVLYRADVIRDDRGETSERGFCWKSPVTMPQWASRWRAVVRDLKVTESRFYLNLVLK